jgi:peptide deformylase
MAQLQPISQLGAPILRQIAQPIDDPQAEWVKILIDDLLATLRQSNGVGIAAPQIAHSHRLLIVASRPNVRYPHAPEMEPTAMINPKILSRSAETVTDWEGCLSVPGIRGLVERCDRIQVEYLTCDGKTQQQELTGFVARIFQHEFDHLEGLVFLDQLHSTRDIITEQEYLKVLNVES